MSIILFGLKENYTFSLQKLVARLEGLNPVSVGLSRSIYSMCVVCSETMYVVMCVDSLVSFNIAKCLSS